MCDRQLGATDSSPHAAHVVAHVASQESTTIDPNLLQSRAAMGARLSPERGAASSSSSCSSIAWVREVRDKSQRAALRQRTEAARGGGAAGAVPGNPRHQTRLTACRSPQAHRLRVRHRHQTYRSNRRQRRRPNRRCPRGGSTPGRPCQIQEEGKGARTSGTAAPRRPPRRVARPTSARQPPPSRSR